MVTASLHNGRKSTEMTPLKALLLSMFMLTGILMWGAGIYSAGATGDRPAIDGYGVTQAAER